MKKLFAITACCLALAACGEHDREYFKKHPEEAAQKVQEPECAAKIQKAEKSDDTAAKKALADDKECYEAFMVSHGFGDVVPLDDWLNEE